MLINLRNIIITHIIYETNINCLLNLVEIKKRIFTSAKLRKNILFIKIKLGSIQITGFGYIKIHLTRFIIHSIINIKNIFHRFIQLLQPFLNNYSGDQILADILIQNIHCIHNISPVQNENLFIILNNSYSNLEIKARQSNCTETPFLCIETNKFNFKLTYLIKKTKEFTIKIYPSGSISIICSSFFYLDKLLKDIKDVL